MKVNLSVDVDDRDRYTIAKYFALCSEVPADRTRVRATRAQVRRFLKGALRSAIKEQVANLRGREKATAARLAEGPRAVVETEELKPPREKQESLVW